MLRKVIATALVVCTLSAGTAHAGDHTGALLGGLAVGAVGGAIIGSALSQQRPAYAPVPAYAPPPQRIEVEASPYDDQLERLHEDCFDGSKGACIRFGILIGQHREHVAMWRRSHPDYFSY